MARRSRGAGSVFYSRSERVWIARVSVGVVGGKRLQHKARATSEEAARLELKRLQRLYAAGQDTPSMTLDTYLAAWLEGVEVRPSTLEAYRKRVRHITQLLGGIPVNQLQPDDVRRLFRDRQRAGLAAGTIAGIHRTLVTALEVLRRERRIPDNPARLVRGPRIEREPVRAVTAQDAQAILAAVRGHHLEGYFTLLLGSGMRAGEASRLEGRDIDWKNRTATIRHGKTSRSVRTVPLPEFVMAALRAERAKRPYGPTAPVFTAERSGGPVNIQAASHAFHRLLEAAGLPRMRQHDLRHATATLMLASGTSMRVIADQLGHADPAITARIYSHVTPASHRAAVDALDEAVGGE